MIGGGRGSSHASVRARYRPSDLDGLRRLLKPEHADPGLGVKGDAARSCAVRLRARDKSGARTTAGRVGEDDRSDLGRKRERCEFRSPKFRGGASEHAGSAKSPGGLSTHRPTSKSRRSRLRRSTSDALAQARMQMAFALSAPVSYPLLLIVVGWVVCLFCGFGLMSRGTVTSVLALAVGSIAVASAVLVILELSTPYSGVFRRFGARRWSRRWRSWGRSRAGGRHSTLPGFITPFGSSAALIWRITASETGILPSREQRALELANAVLGGVRAAEARDDSVHDLVHRLPGIEKGLLVGADRLRHVEVDVAVAEVAEGDHAGPGANASTAGVASLINVGTRPTSTGDVVLDRTAFFALRIGQALAQLPEVRALLERGGDRGVLDDALARAPPRARRRKRRRVRSAPGTTLR